MNQPGSAEKRKKQIGIIVGIVIAAIAYFAAMKLFLKPESFDQILVKTAIEVNKTCPMMVDKETRLNNSVALPGKILQYNYTMVNYELADIDTTKAKPLIEANIISAVKTSPKMKIMRDNAVTLVYHYADKKGVFITDITITPEKYGVVNNK